MSFQPYLWLFALSLFLLYFIRRFKSPLRGLPLPPGPKPRPIIGNILDMPSEFVWETYDKWFKEFQSDVVYVHVTGAPIVIVNTYEAAVELFERRSVLYSSRVRLPMMGELMGWNEFHFGLIPNNNVWRTRRRLFNEAFNRNASKQFEPQLGSATHQFLLRLIERPGNGNLMEHIRHLTGSFILDIMYGIKVLPDADPYINLAEKTMQTGIKALVPGRFWVDFFPWLKYVPKWFPGAGFRRQADEWAKYAKEMAERPFEATKQSMNEGRFTPSFTSQNLDNINSGSSLYYDERIVRGVAAISYAAGSDTTGSALSTFGLAMLLYPEVQKKAQAELDGVLNGHLPTFDDEEYLPYVTAVVYETLRWKAVAPIAIPHRLVSDDIYKGYRLPAGSMIIPNAWSMLYDESMYPDPATFNPDRFLKDGKLNPEVRDPRLIAFGFGRRICPGRHTAYSSAWITIASTLATMDITKALDENGQVVELSGEYTSGVINSPKPFPCTVTPRSKDAEGLVRAAALK